MKIMNVSIDTIVIKIDGDDNSEVNDEKESV